MTEKNSIIIGLALGAIVPVLGYVAVEFIFNFLTDQGYIDPVSSSTSGRRFRTIALIALCSILIPFNYAKNHKYDQMMRGIMIPAFIYVAAWIWKFSGELF
jgi:amino acid permease